MRIRPGCATESGLGARSDQGIAPYAKDRGLCGFARGGAGTEEKRAGEADCHTSDIGHWFAMTCFVRCCADSPGDERGGEVSAPGAS